MDESSNLINQNELFVALYVIGELKPKDKLGIYQNHITIHPSNNFFQKWMTRIKRTIWFETKQVSYEFIQECIISLESQVNILIEKNDVITISRLLTYIQNVKDGLNNLSQTYIEDVNMVGKLKCQIENLGLLEDKMNACLKNNEKIKT
jgi:hypothetical protein